MKGTYNIVNVSGNCTEDIITRVGYESEYLSFQTVYHWTTGRSIPEIGNLYVLSQYLEVPVDTLIVPFDNGKSDISSRIQLVDRSYREIQYYLTNAKYLRYLPE